MKRRLSIFCFLLVICLTESQPSVWATVDDPASSDPGKVLLQQHLRALRGQQQHRSGAKAHLQTAPPPLPGKGRPSLPSLHEIGETAGVSASEIVFWKTHSMSDGKTSLGKRQVVALALANSPELEAARQTFEATKNRYGQLGFLQDFAASYQGLRNHLMLGSGTPARMMMDSLEANEWPMNSRVLLERVVDANERAVSHKYLMIARDVTFRVSEIFSSLQITVQTERLILRQIDLSRRLKENAKNRYAQGLDPYLDINIREAEEEEIKAMAEELIQEKDALLAELSEEMGLKNLSIDRLDLNAGAEPPKLKTTLSQLQRFSETKQQELGVMRQQILAMDWMIQMIRQGSVLSFVTSLSYPKAKGGFSNSPMLPFTGQVDEAVFRLDYVKELQARKRAMIFDLKARIRMTKKKVSTAFFGWKSAMSSLGFQRRTIQPSTKEIIEAAHIAYKTGTGSYAGFLEAQKRLIEKELAEVKLRRGAWRAFHELALAVGSFHLMKEVNEF